jgi:hypothetical protein
VIELSNPFHYGEVVRGADFTDRESELKQLVSEFSGQIRIFMVSPRRYGKTSLIVKTLDEIKSKGNLTVYVDLFRASSVEEFVDIYAKSIFASVEGSIEKTIRFVKEMLPSLSPEITLDEEGKPSLSLGLRRGRERNMAEIFDLPQRIAEKRGRRMVVALDEFQEIAEFGGTKIEKILRSHIQTHNSVSYLFAGSKRHILTEMVMNRSRAFFGMGKLMNLDKIPENLFCGYIQEKFRKTGYKADVATTLAVIREADNVPNNVQMLCHELWELCRDRQAVEEKDIKEGIESLVKTRSVLYSAAWESLSLHQRRLLKAIALEGEVRAPTSSDFIHRYNLSSAASVQRSLQRLIERDILDKQENGVIFTDVFMKDWIRLKIA